MFVVSAVAARQEDVDADLAAGDGGEDHAIDVGDGGRVPGLELDDEAVRERPTGEQ